MRSRSLRLVFGQYYERDAKCLSKSLGLLGRDDAIAAQLSLKRAALDLKPALVEQLLNAPPDFLAGRLDLLKEREHIVCLLCAQCTSQATCAQSTRCTA